MLSLVIAFLRSLTAASHSRRHLVMENLALRHQLLVLNRTAKAPALRNSDQLFWAALCAMWSRWTKALVIVQPQTVVRWHQAGFRLYWHWRSRRRSGRTLKDRELIDLLRRMWQANPTWGSPRIRAELAKLGLEVSAATVRKYRPKGERGPPSQSWRALPAITGRPYEFFDLTGLIEASRATQGNAAPGSGTLGCLHPAPRFGGCNGSPSTPRRVGCVPLAPVAFRLRGPPAAIRSGFGSATLGADPTLRG